MSNSPTEYEAGCRHRYPDGTGCPLGEETHEGIPFLSQLHGYPAKTPKRPMLDAAADEELFADGWLREHLEEVLDGLAGHHESEWPRLTGERAESMPGLYSELRQRAAAKRAESASSSALNNDALDNLDASQIRSLGHMMDVAQSRATFASNFDQGDASAMAAISWIQGYLASDDPGSYRVNP